MGWIAIAVGALSALLLAGAALIVLVARERRTRQRLQVLADVAAVSDNGGGLEETFEAICAILVPDFADFCMIDVIDDDRIPRRAAVRVAPGADDAVERGLAEREPSVPDRMLGGAHRSSLKPRFYERMSDRDLRELSHDTADLDFLRRLGVRSAITMALKARGRVTGALTVGVAWSGRRYSRDDERFAWILSGRIALALDNSGLFADLEKAERARSEIAETLQRGLLPPPLPHIPGWSIAAMYRPAGAENEVGGDFYDVFRVPGGWMLVVGDVTGRGAQAASMTAVARYTLRTAALLSDDPLTALATLNRALLARGDATLCTLVAVTIGGDSMEAARLAVAGHPPPLLIEGGSVRELGGTDPVLGAFPDAEWAIHRSSIEAGQQLVIVTDGIAEARGPDGRFGEVRLRSELKGVGNPAQALQRIEVSLHDFTGGSFEDDVAVLAIARAAGRVSAGAGDGSQSFAPAIASIGFGDA